MRTIGFIGLGTMGEPMCRNLATKQSIPVIAFDLDPAPLARLGGDGVTAASNAQEVAEATDVILLSLPSGEEVRALCFGEDGLIARARAEQTIIDTGTSPPALARELYAACKARGADFADAPIARTRQAAIEGTLSIMVGAEPSVFAHLRPILDCMASDVSHCGGPGAGQIVKILNNMILFQNILALSEARAIARRAGLDDRVLFETLTKGSADSFALRNHGMKSLIAEDFPEGAFPVRYAFKDLSYALELADQEGVAAKGAELVRELFERAIAQGWGERYHPIISKLVAGD